MSNSNHLPVTEMMPGWGFHLMRMSWKVTDLFSDPSKSLDQFQIQEGWHIIDYGCGPGRYIKKASKLVGQEGKVYAVDIHETALQCVRKSIKKNKLSNVYPIEANAYFAPIPENSADLIYVLDVFHMVSQPNLFLQELHRLLKTAGILILEDGHQKRQKTINKVLRSLLWEIQDQTPRHLVLSPKYKIPE
jgi:ubiquinone/menaquinone biosynthesis C-methylase UbiE